MLPLYLPTFGEGGSVYVLLKPIRMLFVSVMLMSV